jgi:hypothetical protein
MENQINNEVTPADVGAVWRAHQADRAWIEWGVCWPPLSVRRPRCRACRMSWPCASALGAHARLTDTPPETTTSIRRPVIFRG